MEKVLWRVVDMEIGKSLVPWRGRVGQSFCIGGKIGPLWMVSCEEVLVDFLK